MSGYRDGGWRASAESRQAADDHVPWGVMGEEIGPGSGAGRITSIDALRGLVIFTMIFVNDIAGAKRTPWWMKHYSDNFKGSGMTFVDLVFPAFLFIVGMSIPIALGARIARGERMWKLILHVLLRTVSLLVVGILMVNSESGPSGKVM